MNSVGSVYLLHLLMIFNLFVKALLFLIALTLIFIFFLVITLFILIAFNKYKL